MNAPAQKNLFTGRYRKVKAPAPSETKLQISIVEYVRLMLRKDVVFFHVPNGEWRDKRTASKLKAMGVLPGVADLIFIRRAPWSLDCLPEVLCLELKAGKGPQSDAQLAFEPAVKATGCHYAIARDLDSAIDVLEKYGMLRPRQADGRK